MDPAYNAYYFFWRFHGHIDSYAGFDIHCGVAGLTHRLVTYKFKIN
jgi:hypothetical protein